MARAPAFRVGLGVSGAIILNKKKKLPKYPFRLTHVMKVIEPVSLNVKDFSGL